MRILIAPDKFKGSLSAVAAAEALARGWRAAWPEAVLALAPIADGGEGFAETLCQASRGSWVEIESHDPLGRPVRARYAWIEAGKLAVIDMSETSGLWRLNRDERNPLQANTFGTGQLIRHAAARGARKILVGLGGSATTDAGAGMAAALGYEFTDTEGQRLTPNPGNLHRLHGISARYAMALPEIVAACDVTNPLLGPRGTARVFGPQKGADGRTVKMLEQAMQNVAEIVQRDLGSDFRESPGAGAAGGIGFGLMSFCHATMRSGFDLVAEVLRLDEQIAASDLILTGEGRLDTQTLEGKGPAGVAALAHRHGKPVVAFAGSIEETPQLDAIFDGVCPIVDRPAALEEAMAHGAEFLERAAHRTARLLRLEQAWKKPAQD